MDIRHYLRTRGQAERIYYYPNPGNAGDALIACATFQLFHELGLDYQIIGWPEFDPAHKVVIYGGGGNFVDLYSDAREFITRCHRTAKRLIVLPQTIVGHEDVLRQLGSNVDIIVRERISYDHVRTSTCRANLFLMDDMAFHLDVKRVLAAKPNPRCYRIRPGTQLKNVLKIGLFQVKQLVQNPRDHHYQNRILNCFRVDEERSARRIPWNNIDLSRIFNYGTNTEHAATFSSFRVLQFLNRYQVIRTNRLHLCIAGALLGRQVAFYPGSYFKCEAVYQYSIKDRFSNVSWMG